MTFRVTAVTLGTVGQLVPAQAAQNMVGICRDRQNLALLAGFLFLEGKLKMCSTAHERAFSHSFSCNSTLLLKL